MGRVGRRQFLVVAGTLFAAPLARAQQARRIYRIGVVARRHDMEPFHVALEQGLRDLGYLPGKDVVIEYRSADGNRERLPEIVRSIVQSKPDVILTGLNPATTAVMAATQSIPIVMTMGSDVIRAGYARSLAKPGGNVTGIAWDFDDAGTVIKRLELLKEIAPKITRIAFLWDPPYREQYQTPMDAAALALGLRTSWHEFSGDPERDFAEMTRLQADAVYLLAGGRLFVRRAEISALATKHRLPMAGPTPEYVDAGGLISHGPMVAGMYRAAARHIDKILKGAKPGDIPIERPTVYEVTINLKTAKALGLKIPQAVLLRADRVIE